MLVFVGGQVLPGDIGRAILGPFADQRAVDALNHELGVDRPLLVQYGDWICDFVHGDMGTSYIYPRAGLRRSSATRWSTRSSSPPWPS